MAKLQKYLNRSKGRVLELATSVAYTHPYLSRLKDSKVSSEPEKVKKYLKLSIKVLMRHLGYELMQGRDTTNQIRELAKVLHSLKCNVIPK